MIFWIKFRFFDKKNHIFYPLKTLVLHSISSINTLPSYTLNSHNITSTQKHHNRERKSLEKRKKCYVVFKVKQKRVIF